MAITTFYPDPNAESTSVDGQISVNGDIGNGSWTAKRDASAGDVAFPSLATMTVALESSNASGLPFRSLGRCFILFDTSAIADTDTVTDATLSLYFASASNGWASLSTAQKKYHIVASTPASNTDLVVGDYDQLGSTSYANLDFSAITTSAYNAFVLDSAGRTAVSKTGVSKFGSRGGADLDNSPPAWESAKEILMQANSADTSGTSTDPKLVVTHSAAGSSSVSPSVSPSSSASPSVSPSSSVSPSVSPSSSASPSVSPSSSISPSISPSASTSPSSSPSPTPSPSASVSPSSSASPSSSVSPSVSPSASTSPSVSPSSSSSPSVSPSASASPSSSTSPSVSPSASFSPSASISPSPSPARWEYETKNTATWAYQDEKQATWSYQDEKQTNWSYPNKSNS